MFPTFTHHAIFFESIIGKSKVKNTSITIPNHPSKKKSSKLFSISKKVFTTFTLLSYFPIYPRKFIYEICVVTMYKIFIYIFYITRYILFKWMDGLNIWIASVSLVVVMGNEIECKTNDKVVTMIKSDLIWFCVIFNLILFRGE